MKKVVWADLSDYGPLAAEDEGGARRPSPILTTATTGPTYRSGRVSCPFIAAIIRLRFGDGGSNGGRGRGTLRRILDKLSNDSETKSFWRG